MDSSKIVRAADRRAARLEEFRQGAWMEKPTFVIGLRRLGLLSDEEARLAGRGELPPTFVEALEDLPDSIDPVEAEIVWGGISRVWRADRTLAAVVAHRGIDPLVIDRLFGWRD